MTSIADQAAPGIFARAGESSSHHRSSWVAVGAAAGAAVERLVMTLLDWQERARERRMLLTFDRAALKDFGRSRADAAGEGEKPFWRS